MDWRKHYYALCTLILARSDSLKFKLINDGFVPYKHKAFHKMLIDGLVKYCDVFISCLDILMAPIYCRGSSGELPFTRFQMRIQI